MLTTHFILLASNYCFFQPCSRTLVGAGPKRRPMYSYSILLVNVNHYEVNTLNKISLRDTLLAFLCVACSELV